MKIKCDFQCNSSSCSYIFSINELDTSDILECLGRRISTNDIIEYYDSIVYDKTRNYYELSIPYNDNDLDDKIINFLTKKGIVLEVDCN